MNSFLLSPEIKLIWTIEAVAYCVKRLELVIFVESRDGFELNYE